MFRFVSHSPLQAVETGAPRKVCYINGSITSRKKTPRMGRYFCVPEMGLEPIQPLWPRDFKSLVSTIPPFGRPTPARIAPAFYVKSGIDILAAAPE